MTIAKEESPLVETAVSRKIRSMLAWHGIEARKEDVTVRHPVHGEHTVSPSVYAVYLAFIRANYTLAVLNTPSNMLGAYQHFVSMIDGNDDLRSFTDEQLAEPGKLLDEAEADYRLCSRSIVDVGLWHSLCD